MLGLLARKIGMTEVFDEEGNLAPVTVLKVEPNTVVGRRTAEKDGYQAVILGIGEMKPQRVSKPYAGQFGEGVSPKKYIREFRDFDREAETGGTVGVEIFEGCRYVDVTGVSKGKGFQGVVRRWGFGGGRKTHGSKFHREPGSTGQSTYPHKTFKNMKLPGRMGREKVTALSLRVIRIDTEQQTILVRGAVPGNNKGLCSIRPAVKK
jgi:large subunit ribosomal protein L3